MQIYIQNNLLIGFNPNGNRLTIFIKATKKHQICIVSPLFLLPASRFFINYLPFLRNRCKIITFVTNK